MALVYESTLSLLIIDEFDRNYATFSEMKEINSLHFDE
jgi:hypothetical protein